MGPGETSPFFGFHRVFSISNLLGCSSFSHENFKSQDRTVLNLLSMLHEALSTDFQKLLNTADVMLFYFLKGISEILLGQ